MSRRVPDTSDQVWPYACQVSVIGTEYFLAFNSGTIATSVSYVNQYTWVSGARLRKISINCDNAGLPGTVTVRLYKGANGAVATTLVETQTVAVAVRRKYYDVTFAAGIISAHDNIAITLSPSATGPSNLSGQAVFTASGV